MVKITINRDECEGADCAECAGRLPNGSVNSEGDEIVIQNTENCSLCEVCVDVCPNQAIKIEDD